jgi:hypothetical protein
VSRIRRCEANECAAADFYLEKNNPDRYVAVLIPELVENHWYYFLLHNNRSQVLKALLLFSGDQRITVVNIPWHLK